VVADAPLDTFPNRPVGLSRPFFIMTKVPDSNGHGHYEFSKGPNEAINPEQPEEMEDIHVPNSIVPFDFPECRTFFIDKLSLCIDVDLSVTPPHIPA